MRRCIWPRSAVPGPRGRRARRSFRRLSVYEKRAGLAGLLWPMARRPMTGRARTRADMGERRSSGSAQVTGSTERRLSEPPEFVVVGRAQARVSVGAGPTADRQFTVRAACLLRTEGRGRAGGLRGAYTGRCLLELEYMRVPGFAESWSDESAEPWASEPAPDAHSCLQVRRSAWVLTPSSQARARAA